jgi:hypothetical protein
MGDSHLVLVVTGQERPRVLNLEPCGAVPEDNSKQARRLLSQLVSRSLRTASASTVNPRPRGGSQRSHSWSVCGSAPACPPRTLWSVHLGAVVALTNSQTVNARFNTVPWMHTCKHDLPSSFNDSRQTGKAPSAPKFRSRCMLRHLHCPVGPFAWLVQWSCDVTTYVWIPVCVSATRIHTFLKKPPIRDTVTIINNYI